jgi:hypothetical protein
MLNLFQHLSGPDPNYFFAATLGIRRKCEALEQAKAA